VDQNNKATNIQQLFKDFRQKSGSLWLLLGAAGIGIILLLGGNGKEEANSGPVSEKIPVKVESSEIIQTEKRLESELESILEQIDGVGNVSAKVHLKSGNRRVWERQSRMTKRSQQQQDQLDTEESASDELVLANGNGADSPVLREEIAPEIDGVLIVAAGAGDPRIKQVLFDTVTTILHLPPHRVMVTAGTGKEKLP
jgi:stage III sporulation protein AG